MALTRRFAESSVGKLTGQRLLGPTGGKNGRQLTGASPVTIQKVFEKANSVQSPRFLSGELVHCIGTLRSLSNDDGDVDENGKKAIGLD